MMQAPESRKGPNLAFAPWASANRPTRRRVLREAEMRSVPMVVAHIFGHQPFQMALIQDNYVIQQVSSATSYPAFRNPCSSPQFKVPSKILMRRVSRHEMG